MVAYGALVPRAALDVPRHGWVNLHFSLLPAWRGAAPVQAARAARRRDHRRLHLPARGGPRHRPGLRRGHRGGPPRPTPPATCSPGSPSSGAALLVATLDGIADGTLRAVPQPRRRGLATRRSRRSTDAQVDWAAPAVGGRPAESGPAPPRPAPGRRSAASGSSSGRCCRRPRGRRAGSGPGGCRSRSGGCWSGTGHRAGRAGRGAAAPGKRRCRRRTGRAALRPAVRTSGWRDMRRAGDARAAGGRRRRRSARPEPRRRRPWRPRPPRRRPSARGAAAASRPGPRWPHWSCCAPSHARDAYANLALPAILRRHGLRDRDAALATELGYGTLRAPGAARRRDRRLHRTPAAPHRVPAARRPAPGRLPAAAHPRAAARGGRHDRRAGARRRGLALGGLRQRRAPPDRRAQRGGLGRAARPGPEGGRGRARWRSRTRTRGGSRRRSPTRSAPGRTRSSTRRSPRTTRAPPCTCSPGPARSPPRSWRWSRGGEPARTPPTGCTSNQAAATSGTWTPCARASPWCRTRAASSWRWR